MTEPPTTPLPTPTVLGAGSHTDLGVTRTAAGTNVAVHCPAATSMRLCLLSEDGSEQWIALPEHTGGVWHGLVEPLAPGSRYGLRADGPHAPALNPHLDADRLLLDPYARAVGRHAGGWCGVVTDPADDESYDWGQDAHPRHPWERTVIYEAHVKGLTMRHPGVPESLRGTYAGLAHPVVVEELVRLGVTAVELLPVQQFASEPGLAARGASNYWGYNTLGFFAPHDAYAARTGAQLGEFKDMVRALHTAGLEVLLDVVYNHTAEGGRDLPTLSLRGLDDEAYYLHLGDGGGYLDVTGCGNTVQASHPVAARLILDSLRYWVTQLHVDGFRFDLAPVLAREGARVTADARLLQAIADDPVLAGTKLVAEPWDATPEGYLVGRFPAGWSEWNDRFRDDVRDFWRGEAQGVRELAYRLSGSGDLYGGGERQPWASVNFVTSHDGFTLRDSVSYENKHNGGNGEDNRDGHGDNRTWNCGVEGDTDDEEVLAVRRRQAANLLGTVLLSTGVPLLTAGDERGRTQRGNNNAYCQDNEVSWLDWAPDGQWAHLRDLTRQLTALRAAHPALRPRHFLRGRRIGEVKDLAWFHPDGHQMTAHDWADPSVQGVGMYLSGLEAGGVSFLLLFDAGPQVGAWTLPGAPWAAGYDVELDTSATLSGRLGAGVAVDVAERCLVVLRAAQSEASRGNAATARTTSV